jgi:hypothetical protein
MRNEAAARWHTLLILIARNNHVTETLELRAFLIVSRTEAAGLTTVKTAESRSEKLKVPLASLARPIQRLSRL